MSHYNIESSCSHNRPRNHKISNKNNNLELNMRRPERSAFCFVPILCPFRAQAVPGGFQRSIEMTIGRRAPGLTIGSKSRPLVELSKGRGSPDHWVKPRAVPSSRRFMPSCAHAVPKAYEVVIPDQCIPVPVPKRARPCSGPRALRAPLRRA
jgi:hypothetical protein